MEKISTLKTYIQVFRREPWSFTKKYENNNIRKSKQIYLTDRNFTVYSQFIYFPRVLSLSVYLQTEKKFVKL